MHAHSIVRNAPGLALLGALAALSGPAHAQVTLYGALDVAVSRIQSNTKRITVGRGDNNKLGFKAVEDLGGGLTALMQMEARFEPDTGTTESAPNRPFWQGETRVGLRGDFGTLRLGRGLTAVQDTLIAFETWGQVSNRGNLTAYETAAYNGDPLSPGSSQNRWSNAVFYNSPIWGGAQFNLTVASTEALTAGTPTTTPVSFSGTYGDGALNLMVGWEKNAIKSELSNLGATYDFGSVKLFATLAQSKPVVGAKSSAWVLGTRYSLGASTFIAGYGHRKPDGSGMNDQISLGYQYALSKRTFVYTDAFRSRFPSVSNARVLDVGVHHSF